MITHLHHNVRQLWTSLLNKGIEPTKANARNTVGDDETALLFAIEIFWQTEHECRAYAYHTYSLVDDVDPTTAKEAYQGNFASLGEAVDRLEGRGQLAALPQYEQDRIAEGYQIDDKGNVWKI